MMESWTSADGGWMDYRASGGTCSQEVYAKIARGSLAEIGDELLIPREWTHDNQRLMPLDVRPLETELARLSADFSPAAGADGPTTLLGHVVDYLSMSEPSHRALMVHAIAAYLFHSASYGAKPLYRFWLRSKPKGDVLFREAVAKLSRVPMGLWRVEEVTSDGAILNDLIGLGPRFQPEGPVAFRAWSLSVGDVVLCRVAMGRSHWLAVHAIGLPAEPPADEIRAAVDGLLQSSRLHFREATVEDVLRWRGHAFHRWCIEWAFGRTEKLPYCGPLSKRGM